MDTELKIVGAIIIAIMFLSNTGIGIWIYRIMKASEKVTEIEQTVTESKKSVTDLEKQLTAEKQNLIDKLNGEREERIKIEGRLSQVEKDNESLRKDLSKNAERFLNIAQKFDTSITHLNTSMKNFSDILSEVKIDLKDIKASSQK